MKNGLFALIVAALAVPAAAINPLTALRERALARQAAQQAAAQAVPDPGPRDPSPVDPPAQTTPVDVLVDLLVELSRQGVIVNALGDVVYCAQNGGTTGLTAGMGRAIVTCESDDHGHPSVYQVYLSADSIAAYNAARGGTVQVAGDAFGYGIGAPTPGVPSLNFTEITAAHTGPALARVHALREAERRAERRNPGP
ncbi:MAG: hypothetical protein SF051_12810 [Elusimicrobiota bacterium]|nr:hypothetical protein [Elusimicrobiota bacterium]